MEDFGRAACLAIIKAQVAILELASIAGLVPAINLLAFVKELAAAIMVLGVTAAELASPIAKQEASPELGPMLAAAEARVTVLAWLDPRPSSSYLEQVLHDDM